MLIWFKTNDSLSPVVSFVDKVAFNKKKKQQHDDEASTVLEHSNDRCRVGFDLEQNEYYGSPVAVHEENSDEVDIRWYSASEIQEFRSASNEAVQNALREQKLRSASGSCCEEDSYHSVLYKLYKLARKEKHFLENAMELLKPAHEEALQRLYVDRTNDKKERSRLELIGLEYQLVRAIKKDSRYIRQSIQGVVRDIQTEYRNGLWKEKPQQELMDEFRDSCHAFTQAPCLFAQFLAQARAAAPS